MQCRRSAENEQQPEGFEARKCSSRFLFCFACIACIARMLVFVTRGEQRKNSFGNRGACGLGEGLQSNGSLKKLDLVIFFLYLFLCC